MKISRTNRLSILLIAGVVVVLSAPSATAEQVSREQDIVNLRLGQRIMVDDGSCPAGQIKEVSGARLTPDGVLRTVKCIPRMGTKK